MQRINTTDGRFKNYNKINLTAGTVITAEWLNAVQEEITNAIEAFGVSLSANNNDQLKNIITNILNNKIDTSNADSLFPSMSGQIGKFLCTDGTTRFWSDPVTNLFALLSSKGIVYIDGSNKAKTSSSLTWDYTNNRLGIGTQTPNNTIHIPGLINFNPTTLSTFLGILAGNVSTGLNNIGIGSDALRLATSAASNIAVGNASLYSLLSGINNTAIGYNAGYLNTGSNNVFIGYQAGYNETGSQKLYIANTSTSTPLIYGDFSTGRLGFGTTTLTDKLNISGSITISDQIKSTLVTGTAPLLIASTTLVSNLNADLLDGQEGSYYTNASNLSSGTISADRLPSINNVSNADTVDNFHASQTAGAGQIPVTAATTGNLPLLDDSLVLWGSGSSGILGNSLNGFISIKTNGTERLKVLTSGRVLIGTSLPTDDESSALQINGVIATNNQIKSTLATGTSPFSITSTTLVTNLNADLLDGQEGSYYTNASNISTGTLSSDRLPSINASNSDTVDTFHASQTAGASQIPVLTTGANLLLGSDTDDAANKLQVTGRAIANGFVHRSYNQAGTNGPWSLDASNASYTKITPAQSNSVTVTNGTLGQEIIINITAAYDTAYTVTFSTGFRSSGTISSPATTGYSKIVKFVHDGTSFIEVSRTGDIPS